MSPQPQRSRDLHPSNLVGIRALARLIGSTPSPSNPSARSSWAGHPLFDDLDALVKRHPPAPTWPDQVLALLEDYLTTLTEHHQVAAWLDSDKAVLNHPEIGARLHRYTNRMRQAITGPTTSRTAATARAIAALGSLWRPVRALTAAQLAATTTPSSTPQWPAARQSRPPPRYRPADHRDCS
jgi:hypothetical protein